MHRRRQVDEKSCVIFLLCDPGWYVQRTSCPEQMGRKHTHTHTYARGKRKSPGLFSVTIFEFGNIYRGVRGITAVFRHHGNSGYFLDGNRPLWYILPWYSAPTVMHDIFWMVIVHYVWYMLPWYSTPMVTHGIFWIVTGHSGTFYCGIQPPR